MPISMICHACNSKINAPDAAAGKRVKCPKPGCGTLLTIPAPEPQFEVIEDEEPAPVVPTPPKKAKVIVHTEDEEAPKVPKKKLKRVESEEAEPRARKKKRQTEDDDEEESDIPEKKNQNASMSPILIVAVVIGSILLLSGVGYGVYVFTSKKSETVKPGPAPAPEPPLGYDSPVPGKIIPAGWIEHRAEGDNFKMYMGKFNNAKIERGFRVHKGEDSYNQCFVEVNVFETPDAPVEVLNKQLNDQIEVIIDKSELKLISQRIVQFCGADCLERTVEKTLPATPTAPAIVTRSMMRTAIRDNKAYLVVVFWERDNPKAQSLRPDDIFSTFEFLK